MIRRLNFILLVSTVFALVGVYALKNQVEGTAAEKREIELAIEAKKARLSVLRAEWAYLNQPGHIAPIIQRHAEALGLEFTDQKQFGHIEDLPMRPKGLDNEALDQLFSALEDGVDPTQVLMGSN